MDLRDFSKEIKKDLSDKIALLYRNLLKEIRFFEKTVADFFQQVFDSFIDLEEKFKEHLDAKTATIIEEIQDLYAKISNDLGTLKDQILMFIDPRFDALENQLTEVLTLLGSIQISVEAIEATVATVLTTVAGLLAEINAALALQSIDLKRSINLSEIQISNKLGDLKVDVDQSFGNLRIYIDDQVKKINPQLSKDFETFKKELQEKLDEKFKNFSNEVSEEVSLKVVGEAYTKWDRLSSYYPTLVFIFTEKLLEGTPRKSQIKTRLLQKAEELTDLDIENLRNRISQNSSLSYSYGSTRANYVSSDKRWKTTVFVSSKEQVNALFTKIGFILQEEINFDLFSYTYLKQKRPRITTRSSSLVGINLNLINYDETFQVYLKRVVLLVNNLQKPIVLFP